MYTPMDLWDKTLEAIRKDIEHIHRDLAPCDIVLADIDVEIPDERVQAFARIVEEILKGD